MKSSRKNIEDIFQKITYFFYLISHIDTPIDMITFIQKSPEMKISRGVHKSRYQVFYSTPKTRKVIVILKTSKSGYFLKSGFFKVFSTKMWSTSLRTESC